MKKTTCLLYSLMIFVLGACTSTGARKQTDAQTNETRYTTRGNAALAGDSVAMQQPDSVVASHLSATSATAIDRRHQHTFKAGRVDSLTVDGASLYVCKNSLNQDKTLSITPLDSSELAAMPAGMHNITVKGGGYRFLPHGNHFQMAATVVIPFDSTRIPKGYSAKDIHTYYYDENCHKWMVLPKDTVLWQEQLAYASTTHFTDMINGILAVPESPETTGFTPTFLSDIKAADPSTGIMVMQAPEATQNGAASLAYPINIPEGRKGLTPQIALRYSSDGACSWVGYGWSLDMPTIDIETRWGVPLFDPNTETESYLFNGLSFAEEAHREQMRRSADKEFHLRIENAFSKIVRKGNSPKNYTWEVTANDGSVTEYAPVARQGAENNSNIVQWAVTKQTDINGNTISYEYQQVEGKAYISHINYNGFNGGKGLYDVYFVRSDNPYRPDATSSGRLGFLQYDNQQLERVEVKFQDKLVRSYKLNYVQGEFGKVMLASVTETDSDGADLYTHTFDYYNDIADGGLFEGKTEVWKTGERAVFGTPGFVPLQGHGDNLSIISGSESSGLSIGGGCNISYGWSGADVYTGVNYTYSSGEAEGKVTLADFDGDGLPDKVYVRDNHLWYQRNLLNETGKREFGGPVRVGGNVSQFSSTKNSSHTLGVDLGGNVGPISAGVGYSHTWDKSKTTVYMQDFNGDGLTDIAVKGVVYFNRLVDGVPTFLPYSQETENPILSSDANLIGENFNIDYEAEKKEMEEQSPLHDVVRMWRAPFKGEISIGGDIYGLTDSPDGIRYSIQHEKEVLQQGRLNNGETVHTWTTAKVKAGDRIFFRINSYYNGKKDSLKWAPQITYTKMSDEEDTPAFDENGLSTRVYNAQQDYISGEAPVAYAIYSQNTDNIVSISGNIQADRVTDDVHLKIVRVANQNDSTVVYEQVVPSGEILNESMTYTAQIARPDTLVKYLFLMETNSLIDWKKIRWEPVLSCGGTQTHVAASRIMYSNVLCIRDKGMVQDSSLEMTYLSDDIIVSLSDLHIKYNNDDDANPTKHIVLKTAEGKTIGLQQIGENTWRANAALLHGKTVYASVLLDREAKRLRVYSTPKVKFSRQYLDSIQINDTTWQYVEKMELYGSVDCSVFSQFFDKRYGYNYRGWGMFCYNGGARADDYDIIDVGAFKEEFDSDEKPNFDPNNMPNQEDADKMTTPMTGQKLYSMGYSAEHQRFFGNTPNTFLQEDILTSSRLGNQEIEVESISYSSGGGVTIAPVLISNSNSDAVNASAGFSVAGANGSYSHTKSIVETSAMDLNGDRYPDWVMQKGADVAVVQYTDTKGAVSSNIVKLPFGMPSQQAKAWGVGGSLGVSKGDLSSFTISKSNFAAKENNKASNESKNSASVSVSKNFSQNESVSLAEWYDVNGDGLADMVFQNNQVRINLGYGFSEPKSYGLNEVYKNLSESYGSGLSVSVPIGGHAKIGGGLNATGSNTDVTYSLLDINGDGLPDLLYNVDGQYFIRYNQGLEIKKESSAWRERAIGSSVATSNALNLNIAVPIYLEVLPIGITPFVNSSASKSVSRTITSLSDINGDGFPDLLYSTQDNEVTVRLSRIRRTNLLRAIHRPLGDSIVIDYAHTPASYDMPGGKWVMDSCIVYGGYPENGPTRFTSKFEYEGGLYDRYERANRGFAKVTTLQINTDDNSVYRQSVSLYNNRDYYQQNLVTLQAVLNSKSDTIQITRNTYESDTLGTKRVWTKLVKTVTETHDLNQSDTFMATTESYGYDEIGNVTHYTSVAGDEISAVIDYHSRGTLKNSPKSITISSGGNTLRSRASEIDDKGNVTRLTVTGGGLTQQYDMEYDNYGNMTWFAGPENYKGERMSYELTYDAVLHRLPTSVTDAFGYTSSTTYDYLWAVPTSVTDINGQTVSYTYDRLGRLATVQAPYEREAGQTYTLAFDYHTDADVPYARTRHYTAEGDIETYTFCDNLLRPIQVKKTGVVDGVKVNIVSGVQVWDAFGRVISEALPYVEDASLATTLNTTGASEGATQTAYDALDRTVSQILPDSVRETTIKYEIRSGGVGQGLHTTVTDPAGNKSVSVTDERGRTVQEKKVSETGDLTVDYTFDALGQLLEVTHPNGYKTTYTYDGLGRTLSVDHPDAGLTSFTYDLAGNLLTKQTAKLRDEIASGGVITYKYDYNRVTDIVYPKSVFNCVKYTYGEPGAPYGRAGRLVLVEDGSGGEEFFYGSMGEQVKSVRTVMRSITDMRTFVTESSYDSWGRIRTMSYPDGEVVTYGYDAAGQLTTMQGEKDGVISAYITDSKYDKYGNLTYRLLGNGTEETYSYDSLCLRLTRSQLTGTQGRIMDNAYTYDKVDNILSIEGSVVPNAEIGGRYKHSYQYDDLYRLTSATGSCRDTIGYTLNMSYNRMSSPTHKNLQVFGSSVLQSQDFDYLYEDNSKPNAVTRVGQDIYHYDASGNVTYIERDTTWRELVWDEENRLSRLSDNGYTSRYTYDHTGNRTLKSYGPVTEVGINGAAQGVIYHDDDNYTIYPSPYITVDKDRYTKHYYAGTKRICASIGTGDFHNIFGVDGFTLSAGGKDYAEKMKQIELARRLEVKKRGVPPGLPTQKGKTAEPEYYGSGYPELVLGDYSVPEGWPGPKGQLANPSPGVPLSFDDPAGSAEATAGAGFVSDHTPETDQFFFHSDHLGSTSYLTDREGNVSQFVCYIPYGETLVDEHLTGVDSILHNGGYRTKYLFNGKELDNETFLYYYGARYYEPVTTLWYGVDPLAEKYPFNSSYVYCNANPVKYVDPDGETPVGAIVEGIGAFVVTAGIDFLSNWIFEGKGAKEAYNNISWKAAAIDGLSTAAISLFIDGTGSAKYMTKIAKSKAGKLAIDIVKNMSVNIISKIEKGTDFSDIDLTEEFFTATISTLVSNGLSKKADELLESLKSSNLKLYNRLNKLRRDIENGKNDIRIKRDKNQVKVAKSDANSVATKYAKQKTKTKAVTDAAVETGKRLKDKLEGVTDENPN